MERTLILVKPDGVKRGLIGEIISRFEKIGLKIVSMKMIHPDKNFAKKHYPVTQEWYKKVGSNTLEDSRKYNISAKKTIGTEDPIEIGKKVHQWNVEFLTSGPLIAIVIEGIHAIETVRKIAGTTIPNIANPGTIRGDFASTSALHSNIKNRAIQNLVHTSGNKEEAEREIHLWFSDSELFEYETVLEKHLN
ncbi:nucleoside-diphosphate kinase [Candidatus Woesearchaeota archaeon]|nr:nucleoside-diphosphate kinase [Candidatus Woesearchaeota archaeon]